jgi:F0F1-type ATP synthase membrane subunit c/vacuolar-type H+-ATPase subunit K
MGNTAVHQPTSGTPARPRRTVWQTIIAMPVALVLIALMAVGSVILWIGIPIGWIYAVSHMVDSSQPSLGPYVLLIFGIPVTMALFGKLLFGLDHVYARVTGQDSEVRFRAPWLKSMRGERDVARRLTVLEMTMIISVSVALLGFAIWFFGFAGSSLPNT